MASGTTTIRRRKPLPASKLCGPSPGGLRARATAAYAGLFRALGDETRLEIVGLLAARGRELCVCEIEAHFDLSQPTVSHHLRILREAGVVASERRGTWVYCSLEPAVRERLGAFEALLGR
ncbi:MAG TPA: metalloregulator ArsR/SmtB family transcription factor [Planctomycetota bacterium]|nr:metalloregulator ArsR/SmtB family transcription factor [Planctomycetota bacterium]